MFVLFYNPQFSTPLRPLDDLEPDFVLGMGDEAVLRLDVLTGNEQKAELLQGRHHDDGGLHVCKAVTRALALTAEPVG